MHRLSWLRRIFGIVPYKTIELRGRGREGVLWRGFVVGLRHGVQVGVRVGGKENGLEECRPFGSVRVL